MHPVHNVPLKGGRSRRHKRSYGRKHRKSCRRSRRH